MLKIKQRIIAILLVFILVFSNNFIALAETSVDSSSEVEVEGGNSIVASGTCGENVTWELTDDGTLTISGSGEMKDYNYQYEVFRSPWYSYRDLIKSVIIQKGVTSIGTYAFWDCETLESVEIEDTIMSLGTGGFMNCICLDSVIIPDSVTEFGRSVFEGCTGLKYVKLSNKLNCIANQAFLDCTNIGVVIIPSSITTISEQAFDNCPSIEHVLYMGSESERGDIDIGLYNSGLLSGTLHCNANGTEVMVNNNGDSICQICCEHIYGEWITDKEATCIESGSKHKECSICGDIVTEEIGELGHEWDDEYTIDKEATREEEGSKSIRCKVCNSIKSGSEVIIPVVENKGWKYSKNDDGTITVEGYIGAVDGDLILLESLVSIGNYAFNGNRFDEIKFSNANRKE